jgi:hypothetical protein
LLGATLLNKTDNWFVHSWYGASFDRTGQDRQQFRLARWLADKTCSRSQTSGVTHRAVVSSGGAMLKMMSLRDASPAPGQDRIAAKLQESSQDPNNAAATDIA